MLSYKADKVRQSTSGDKQAADENASNARSTTPSGSSGGSLFSPSVPADDTRSPLWKAWSTTKDVDQVNTLYQTSLINRINAERLLRASSSSKATPGAIGSILAPNSANPSSMRRSPVPLSKDPLTLSRAISSPIRASRYQIDTPETEGSTITTQTGGSRQSQRSLASVLSGQSYNNAWRDVDSVRGGSISGNVSLNNSISSNNSSRSRKTSKLTGLRSSGSSSKAIEASTFASRARACPPINKTVSVSSSATTATPTLHYSAIATPGSIVRTSSSTTSTTSTTGSSGGGSSVNSSISGSGMSDGSRLANNTSYCLDTPGSTMSARAVNCDIMSSGVISAIKPESASAAVSPSPVDVSLTDTDVPASTVTTKDACATSEPSTPICSSRTLGSTPCTPNSVSSVPTVIVHKTRSCKTATTSNSLWPFLTRAFALVLLAMAIFFYDEHAPGILAILPPPPGGVLPQPLVLAVTSLDRSLHRLSSAIVTSSSRLMEESAVTIYQGAFQFGERVKEIHSVSSSELSRLGIIVGDIVWLHPVTRGLLDSAEPTWENLRATWRTCSEAVAIASAKTEGRMRSSFASTSHAVQVWCWACYDKYTTILSTLPSHPLSQSLSLSLSATANSLLPASFSISITSISWPPLSTELLHGVHQASTSLMLHLEPHVQAVSSYIHLTLNAATPLKVAWSSFLRQTKQSVFLQRLIATSIFSSDIAFSFVEPGSMKQPPVMMLPPPMHDASSASTSKSTSRETGLIVPVSAADSRSWSQWALVSVARLLTLLGVVMIGRAFSLWNELPAELSTQEKLLSVVEHMSPFRPSTRPSPRYTRSMTASVKKPALVEGQQHQQLQLQQSSVALGRGMRRVAKKLVL